MTAFRAVGPRNAWLAGSSRSYASTSTIRPPTPSTSSVTPIRAGATSCTLRAKNSAGSARVVAGEGGDGKSDHDGTEDAEESAGDDRGAHARERGDEAGLDVSERGRRRDLSELDARDASPERVRRDRPEDCPAQDGADVVRGARGREQEQREPERLGKAEGSDRHAPE